MCQIKGVNVVWVIQVLVIIQENQINEYNLHITWHCQNYNAAVSWNLNGFFNLDFIKCKA